MKRITIFNNNSHEKTHSYFTGVEKAVMNITNNIHHLLKKKKRKGLILKDSENYTWPHNEEELKELLSVSLHWIETTVEAIFSERNKKQDFEVSPLVLFDEEVYCASGLVTAKWGPAYCPGDKKMFFPMSFFDALREDFFENSEDFSMFYVIAHEMAHHIQRIYTYRPIQIGNTHCSSILEAIITIADAEPKMKNKLIQILEIHADYLAGVITHHANKNYKFLQENDIHEWVMTAFSIGDDIIQLRSIGEIIPKKFTHGTWVQRGSAFFAGLETWDFDMFDLDTIIEIYLQEKKRSRRSPVEIF